MTAKSNGVEYIYSSWFNIPTYKTQFFKGSAQVK